MATTPTRQLSVEDIEKMIAAKDCRVIGEHKTVDYFDYYATREIAKKQQDANGK